MRSRGNGFAAIGGWGGAGAATDALRTGGAARSARPAAGRAAWRHAAARRRRGREVVAGGAGPVGRDRDGGRARMSPRAPVVCEHSRKSGSLRRARDAVVPTRHHDPRRAASTHRFSRPARSTESRRLTALILGACWPGGPEDRTERAALDWLRRWRPEQVQPPNCRHAPAPPGIASCVTEWPPP